MARRRRKTPQDPVGGHLGSDDVKGGTLKEDEAVPDTPEVNSIVEAFAVADAEAEHPERTDASAVQEDTAPPADGDESERDGTDGAPESAPTDGDSLAIESVEVEAAKGEPVDGEPASVEAASVESTEGDATAFEPTQSDATAEEPAEGDTDEGADADANDSSGDAAAADGDPTGEEPTREIIVERVVTADDTPAPPVQAEGSVDAGADAVASLLAADAEGEAGEVLPPRTAELKSIVEALIFASPEPLTLKALYKLLDGEPKEDVAAAVEALKLDYERPTGLQFVEVAGGFQIVTRPDLHEWVRRLFHERSTQKLSVQALETLAVVAYRQPVTALEITEIRGVNTSGVMNTLLERHLIKIVGRKQVVGRPFMYATTKEFLIRFGLKDISDLPRVEDMAEALGIENPLLVERSPVEDQLPLEEPEEGASAEQELSEDSSAEIEPLEPPNADDESESPVH